jgi:glycosyltransferase involved in cell wall biosynthesis
MVSVVIPAFNEENAITGVVQGVDAALKAAKVEDFEIIVVDDGSSDGTADRAQKAGARVIRSLQNVGYGFSVKQGINAAAHDTIVITDADGTYPVESIPSLLEHYRKGFNMVVGERTGPHYRESAIKSPLRAIFKWLVEFTVGHRVPDVNSGLRVFSRDEVKGYLPRLSDKFSFTTSQTLAYMLTRKFVHYVPIDYKERIGITKVRLFWDSLGALQMLLSAIVFFNPLKLFVILCALTGLFGVSAVVVGVVWEMPVALWLGIVAFLVTIVVFALGLVAEMLHQANLQNDGS